MKFLLQKLLVAWKRLVRRRRSVVFLHPSYYHFFYLARALRKRGWDAVSVNIWSPDGPFAPYFHGEDINLYDSDPEKFRTNREAFFTKAKERFDLLHFSGDGCMSFFTEYWYNHEIDPEEIAPPDIIEWQKLSKKIAYTSSGCNSAIAQSSIYKWSSAGESGPVCDKCVWQHRPDVCSNKKNLGWGRILERYVDLVFAEMLPALDYMAMPGRVIHEPVTTCLDPEFWKPDLAIPGAHRIAREPDEILLYHGVGNNDTRNVGGRSIKGTPAVFAAIDKLKSEGFPVKLIFVTGMKNTDVRYVQAQCDIIIDQLNLGRYGATAREGMMLGKPVICYINPKETACAKELESLKEAPLVSATEATVYEVLKDLLQHPKKRSAIGAMSRKYALKWHSADACAERYERIYDRLMKGRALSFEN
jgi:glycosyltransferase involved in cell wall biosynthesis